MAIKELAHSVQQHLKSVTGHLFKRSHIYELLAASFGFKSYAALCNDHVLTQRAEATVLSAQHHQFLLKRVSELGYKPLVAVPASSAFSSYIEEQHINVEAVDDIITEPNYGNHFYDELEGLEESEYGDNGYPSMLLEGLKTKARKGDHRAHYALAIIYRDSDGDYDQEIGGEYWYKQQQQGRILSGVEKEWADGHANQLERAEKYTYHLRKASKLGNTPALVDLAEYLNDSSYLDEAKNRGTTDNPMRAAEVADSLGRNEHVKYWLTIAAESGNTDAMRRLIDDFDHDDIERSWMWLYLAKILGTDLTKSNLNAFHEGGQYANQHYDDDIGGPLYIAGDEGARLKPLDEDGKHAAKERANTLFQKLQQSM
ncbi:MAG: hypothetical protein GY779_05185 [Gammaproteobacteria bacterium]|nr:hypothetical protein [Gammaproteobacteria bacterium]